MARVPKRSALSTAVDFSKIDFDNPNVTPVLELAMRRMLEKREQYAYQGRDHELRGVSTAIWILWRTVTDEWRPDDKSNFGELK